MRNKPKAVAIVAMMCAGAVLLIAGCENGALTQQRAASIETRVEIMNRAEALHPVPQMQNFPLREVLVEYTKRADMANHPWYTYIYSDYGTIVAYFVSTTIPVSTNAFLGSTQSTYGSDGRVVLDAPSLDGIYYGGAGSSGNGGWIFIDAVTSAMGIAYGHKILTLDAPMMLETEPMLIRAGE